MSDSAYDLDPGEQRLRIAARLLEDGQSDLEQACDTLLMQLAEPLDLAPGDNFLRSRWLGAFHARREDLCRKAARAALAVLLADDEIDLPLYIDIAFDVPAEHADEQAHLVAELEALVASQRRLIAALVAPQPAPNLSHLMNLLRQAHGEIAVEAESRERSGADESALGLRKLADDLGAAIAEVA